MNAPFSRREPVDRNRKTLPELSSTTALMALEPRYLFDAAALATGQISLMNRAAWGSAGCWNRCRPDPW